MDSSVNSYFYIVPVLVFGPLFVWIFYNFGIKELIKIPGEIRRKRAKDASAAAAFEMERARKRGTGAIWLVRGPNKRPFGLFMQGLAFAGFAGLIGFFASAPTYLYRNPDMALIKLSLNHPGHRKAECTNRSAKELAKLEPNMRAKTSCPRERWPVYVELELDNQMLFTRSVRPSGLSSDGPSSFYQSFVVTAGTHQMTLRLRDKGETGFGFTSTQEITLSPRQVVAAQFNAIKGGFYIR